MIADAMVGWRNPARYIAPLALAVAVTASYLIVHHAIISKHSSTTTTTVQTTTTVARHNGHSGAAGSKATFYVVKPGDSLSGLAAKTGVAITAIEALNPHV
ncbi:MAG: LysM peptidoglycan-binding domain-containing protein, partial [Solirubrobacteraceae bacterium]